MGTIFCICPYYIFQIHKVLVLSKNNNRSENLELAHKKLRKIFISVMIFLPVTLTYQVCNIIHCFSNMDSMWFTNKSYVDNNCFIYVTMQSICLIFFLWYGWIPMNLIKEEIT